MTLLLALGTVQAINRLRKRQWFEAGAVFFPILGGYVMILGGAEGRNGLLFFSGAGLVPVGIALEFMAWRKRSQSTAK